MKIWCFKWTNSEKILVVIKNISFAYIIIYQIFPKGLIFLQSTQKKNYDFSNNRAHHEEIHTCTTKKHIISDKRNEGTLKWKNSISIF